MFHRDICDIQMFRRDRGAAALSPARPRGSTLNERFRWSIATGSGGLESDAAAGGAPGDEPYNIALFRHFVAHHRVRSDEFAPLGRRKCSATLP
jgi:hypothetical protein